MYAVIESGGKQHRVEKGEILQLEKLNAATGDKVKFDKPRQMILLAEQPDDIRVALNCYQPGANNELHYHVGTGQTFLVLKGTAEVKHRHKDLPPEENVVSILKEGDCVLIPANVYYQLHNPGPDHQVVLYQVKQPGDMIAVEGKGVMNNKDYFTQKREDSHDLKQFAEEVPTLSK